MEKKIYIKKSSGDKALFRPEKVEKSIQRTGASNKVVAGVLKKLIPQVKDGMTTKEIYSIVTNLLKEESVGISARYGLRDALLRLGPDGFDFEKYVAAVLRAYGYDAVVPPNDIQGACVTHEIDVVALKEGRRVMIEAKFRHQFNDVISIKDTMSTWARFLDLVEGAQVHLCDHFDECWIVTNARFSPHSLKYGHCKNMMMIGWNHPRERSFAQMVDLTALYPVTILSSVSKYEIKLLAEHNLMLCKEVVDAGVDHLVKELGLTQERSEEIVKMCEEVIGATR